MKSHVRILKQTTGTLLLVLSFWLVVWICNIANDSAENVAGPLFVLAALAGWGIVLSAAALFFSDDQKC
jgi:hypothetical protein